MFDSDDFGFYASMFYLTLGILGLTSTVITLFSFQPENTLYHLWLSASMWASTLCLSALSSMGKLRFEASFIRKSTTEIDKQTSLIKRERSLNAEIHELNLEKRLLEFTKSEYSRVEYQRLLKKINSKKCRLNKQLRQNVSSRNFNHITELTYTNGVSILFILVPIICFFLNLIFDNYLINSLAYLPFIIQIIAALIYSLKGQILLIGLVLISVIIQMILWIHPYFNPFFGVTQFITYTEVVLLGVTLRFQNP